MNLDHAYVTITGPKHQRAPEQRRKASVPVLGRTECPTQEGQNVATVQALCIKFSFSGNITTEEPRRADEWAGIWQEPEQGTAGCDVAHSAKEMEAHKLEG